MRHFLALLVAAIAHITTVATAKADLFRWVQAVPGGFEARAVTTQGVCPQAKVDGDTVPMVIRSSPGVDYPITVCALPVPTTAKVLTIEDVPVALPVADPKRIVIIGDTGCRMKGRLMQACNDPVQWPARLVAEAAAQLKPDLVIHAGDYHYRETACPAGMAGCAGSPFGDTWAVWRADFFSPLETLLRVAPWVAVRGNHEECDRGGIGWSRTLEPTAFDATRGCNAMSPPYAAKAGDVTLAVLDVSTADEEKLSESQAAGHRASYASLARFGSGPMWVLQHRPIWVPGWWQNGMPMGDNKTLAAAAFGTLPRNVDLMISGHHHLFQAVTYDGDLPGQIVSGHGGDWLNDKAPRQPAGLVFGNVRIRGGIDMSGAFGFAMLTKTTDGWTLTNHDKFGTVIKSCTVRGREISCPEQ